MVETKGSARFEFIKVQQLTIAGFLSGLLIGGINASGITFAITKSLMSPSETTGKNGALDSEWYAFGYGSLLSGSSRMRGECGLRGTQEDFIEWSLKNLNIDSVFNDEKAKCIKERQEKQYIPAEIRGYRRGFYERGKVPQKGLPENDLFVRPTYLGLVKDEKYSTTGLLYPLSKADLDSTDKRELDAGYEHATLSKENLAFYSDVDIPENAKVRVYVSKPGQVAFPSKDFPIVQSYVDLFLGGAIEIEENNPEVKNFSLSTCKQTYGWLGGWVNDRPYPRHRAAFSSMRAFISMRHEKIDNLIFECSKENEAAIKADGSSPKNSSLATLDSNAIDSITFTGSCKG